MELLWEELFLKESEIPHLLDETIERQLRPRTDGASLLGAVLNGIRLIPPWLFAPMLAPSSTLSAVLAPDVEPPPPQRNEERKRTKREGRRRTAPAAVERCMPFGRW
jgi:hypothetical protein